MKGSRVPNKPPIISDIPYGMGPPFDSVQLPYLTVALYMVDISRTSSWELFHGL